MKYYGDGRMPEKRKGQCHVRIELFFIRIQEGTHSDAGRRGTFFLKFSIMADP